jgi:hypothetical protein
LLIFDCCYAGNLLPKDVRSPWQARGFECIAACGKNETTNWPGENSFTAALIWALRTLVRKRTRFSTQELQTAIMGAPKFPPKQHVPLIERNEPCDQRLVLAPIRKGDEEAEESPTETSEPEHPKYHLDLRLWYLNKPEEEEISSFARRLRKLMIDDGIGASRIGWLGLKNRELANEERVQQIADAWIRKIRPVPFVGSYSQIDITSSDMERCISLSSESRIKELITTPLAPTQDRSEYNATNLTEHAYHFEDEKKAGTKAEDKPSKSLFSNTKDRDAVYKTPGSTRGILPFLIGGAAFGFIWTFFR